MDREYELFERRLDGSGNWRGLVDGLESMWVTLRLLAHQTGNECFAADAARDIVAMRSPLRDGKRVFQVAYGRDISVRSQVLHRYGYDVTSVCGNQAAMFVLRMRPPFDLFLIGHAAPEQIRLDMIRWLRSRYPMTGIVALTPPHCHALEELRYNAPIEPTDAWLKMVGAAVRRTVP